ncbi:MAG: glycosyl hydrolase family 18 protein [Bryobacteraceae bacterium]
MKNRIPLLLLCACVVSLATATMAMGAACYTPWVSTTAYNGGATVSYASVNYTANWWTQDNEPDTNNGGPGSGQPWTSNGACGGGATATATKTATATATKTATATATATKTATAVGTATKTATATATATKTATATATKTATATATSTGNCYTAWAYPVAYVIGSQVSYQGINYQCIYAHTSNSAWIPPATPTLWQSLGSCTAGPTPTASATPKPTPSATPCQGCANGSLPKHVLTGYWQDFSNGATCLTIAQVPTTYNLIAVAFANATTTAGAVSYATDSGLSSCLGGYTDSQFIADINTAHGRGQKVIISVGGANGTISVSDSTSAANFANSVISLINQFGFDGVDIDLENGLSATYMGSALQQIASAHSGTIITMAPQTVDVLTTGSDYLALGLQIKSILTIMNTQFYNSGSMNGCNGSVYSEGTVDFMTALACTQLQGGLAPSQVGLGLPASPSGAGSGYVSPSTVNAALTCLASGSGCGSFKPPSSWSIRGVMDWSINWDAASGYAFANGVTSTLNSLP